MQRYAPSMKLIHMIALTYMPIVIATTELEMIVIVIVINSNDHDYSNEGAVQVSVTCTSSLLSSPPNFLSSRWSMDEVGSRLSAVTWRAHCTRRSPTTR